MSMRQINLAFVRQRRTELGLTLQQMATALGMKSPANYFKYERGDYAFKANHLPPLTKQLGCEIEELFADSPFFADDFAKTAKDSESEPA